jgi:autotransporter translocation and assembly factor TamB
LDKFFNLRDRFMTRLLKGVLLLFSGLLLIFALLFATMQTKWLKETLQKQLIALSEEAGIHLSIGSIEGDLPFNWTLRDLHAEFTSSDILDIKMVKLRFALLPLFHKEISISYLNVLNAKLLFSEEITTLPPFSCLDLPFHLSIKQLKMDDLCVEKYETGESALFSVKASAKLKRHAKAFALQLKVLANASPESFGELSLRGSHKKNDVESALQVKMRSTKALHPFSTPSFDTDLLIETHLNGPWNTWRALLLQQKRKKLPPLKGSLKAVAHKLDLPPLKWLNRKWNLTSLFTLAPDLSWNFSKIALKSNLLQLMASASLGSDGHLKEADATLSLPQFTLLNLYSPFPLRGAMQIKTRYTPAAFSAALDTEGLRIGSQSYEICRGSIQADLENNEWRGRAGFSAKNRELPIETQVEFRLQPNTLFSMEKFEIRAPDTHIAGNVDIALPSKEIKGAFFGQLLDLSHFRQWVHPGSRLEGSVGAKLELNDHSAYLNLLLSHCRYFEWRLDELSCTANLVDSFNSPQGTLSLEGQGLSLPSFDLTSFDFKTEWDGKRGPYDLLAKGKWREPIEVESSGFWTFNSLDIETLRGILLSKSFLSLQPFSIKREDSHSLQITPCELHIGGGDLSFFIDLRPSFINGYLKANHFPLDLLSLSQPNFSSKGATSVQAHLEGDESSLQGKIDLFLEELDIYQCGKSCPFQARGSLHAQLQDKELQFTVDLKALDQQFLTCTSALPIDYSLSPFEMKIDDQRPLSGDLAFEGRLEEVFDFINIGSHRLGGLLSCHLTLSQNFLAPSLHGEVELTKGSYENYYTGTLLKEIDAKAIAQGGSVELSSFEAKDGEGGRASASGRLNLYPEEKFPYSVTVQLSNLNLLRFDAGSSLFTGPLSIEGTTESASARGELIVPKAELSIPDKLPVDLPLLPVTYINHPKHLEGYTMQPLPVFPFSLNLDLSAPGPIYVTGRGLRSEWKGSAHVQGSFTEIAANGLLNLTKGEFVFSGKVFSLTEGEITLVDQPTQEAYLKLRAELSLANATIIALLNGPISSPILTFQSIPHMPTSTILSYILFNKDISDISPFQAIQIAQTIVTLSGGAGPDVLEKIRKSLGVDRLNIVSGQNGSDQVSVQIGKYLTKGVMVTLSQGVDSSQVIVEVELKHGFLLQAESQNEEEGKFSLKWNRNY